MKELKERCGVFTQKDGSEVIECEIQLSDAKDNYVFLYARKTQNEQYFIIIGESIFGSSVLEVQPDPYVEMRFETVEETADYFLHPYFKKMEELMNIVGTDTAHGRLISRKLSGEYIMGIYNYFCELGIQDASGQINFVNAMWSFCGAEYTITQISNFDSMDLDDESDEDFEPAPKLESYTSLDDSKASAYHDLFSEQDTIINEFMSANMFG